MKFFSLLLPPALALIVSAGSVHAEPAAPAVADSLDACDVTWSTPGGTSFGSMPLGNGDVGANVWVEPGGDVVLYVSKVDAYDAGHMLPKLGRVRITFDPAMDVRDFRQTLKLREGAVAIKGGDVNLRVWIDANCPVIRVDGKSLTPRRMKIAVESLRPFAADGKPLPGKGTAAVLFSDAEPRLAWCYRNMSSEWADRLASQNTPAMVAATRDPILGRTSGCVLKAPGFARENPTTLRSKEPVGPFDISINVLSGQPADTGEWLAEASRPLKSDWVAHKAWWAAFWNRSHIFVTRAGEGTFNLDQCRFSQYPQGSKGYEGHKEIDAKTNAFQITQRYALERFCEAAASRGAVPPPYNGSIFTMDMPAGVLGFDKVKPSPVSPDGRDWGKLSFMWQNTRHPYWSMAARGDYDTIRPGMEFVRSGLDIGRDRSRKLLGIDGAFIMEASWWYNVGYFNWDRMPAHLKFHQIATVELPAIMAEYYEHTRDRAFLDNVLIPCADEAVKYYTNRYPKRDARGRLHIEGVGCAETYQGVTNPCTEMGAIKFLLQKLLTFDIDPARRARWTKLLGEMPGVPLRRIRGLDLLAVGDVYDSGRVICESPELYSIYPFRQVWLGRPDLLANARQSFHVRTTSLDGTKDDQPVETGGWQSSPVQAAWLGLPRESARLASINFNDRFIHWNENFDPAAPYPNRPRARFPGFWECKMDGTPDNDHGANSVNTLQSMILQSDDRKIFLLPAWPEDWDVSFKLRAARNTTVEGVYKAGKWESLKVTPESRRADIVDLGTADNRIRNMVAVACNDRNYLFGLPPMLDGLPTPGPVTAGWLKKYGESLAGTKGGPWPQTTFRDRTLYAFSSGDPAPAPAVPATLLSRQVLAKPGESPVTIIQFDYDQPIEPIARRTFLKDSLTAGRELAGGVVDLGGERTFDRAEFTIELPERRRGESIGFELQAAAADGDWKTFHKGEIYGNIYAKKFAPVTAQRVRLVINAPIGELHVFAPGG